MVAVAVLMKTERQSGDRVCSIQSYMGSGTKVIASTSSACALYQQKFCLIIMSSTSKMHQAPHATPGYLYFVEKNGVVLVECGPLKLDVCNLYKGKTLG